MGSPTRDGVDYSADWRAVCPRCGETDGPESFVCFNCKRPASVAYCREVHSNDSSFWTECSLECVKCRFHYNEYPCKACGTVIGIYNISVLIRSLRRDPYGWLRTYANLTLAISFVIAAWVVFKVFPFTRYHVYRIILLRLTKDKLVQAIAGFWFYFFLWLLLTVVIAKAFEKLRGFVRPELKWRPAWYRYQR